MTLISQDDHLTAGAWAACGYIENLDLTNLRKNNQIVRLCQGLVDNFIFDHYFFCGVTSRYPAFWDRNGGTVTVDDICALMSIRSYSYSSHLSFVTCCHLFVIPGYIIRLGFWIAFVINRISLYRGCFPYILL